MHRHSAHLESALWPLLNSLDDTKTCPLYFSCEGRLKGAWCPCDNLPFILKLSELSDFNIDKYNPIGIFHCGEPFYLVTALANDILEKNRIESLPVPSDIYCGFSKEELQIFYIPLKTYHGALLRLNLDTLIFINNQDPIGMQRMSFYHEAFHALHFYNSQLQSQEWREEKVGQFIEQLAGYFAQCILMPEKFVEEQWHQIKNISVMADVFQVTRPIMHYRLKRLGLI